jgi:formamidopyrimidine-DNA glycosylase
MPELPDVEIYLEALRGRIVDAALQQVRIASPFLLRSVDPMLDCVEGRTVVALHRLGKRIVIELADELFLILHLMIAGRLHWKPLGAKLGGKNTLAAFDFSTGTLLLTEASPKKRASLHLTRGRESLAAHNPGGLEVLSADLPTFREALKRENHTLKRALTNPYQFSGIGNAYSDEILHRAGLSPLAQSQKLKEDQIERLHQAVHVVFNEWIERLRQQTGENFPEKVTAFRPEMAVHGRFGLPCPVCGAKVERIVYAENECNYCPRCQTNGKRLADRALSRLLKDDWPRLIDE